jgi:hypothetical protein
MKDMSDIIDFLKARITEDETEARRDLERVGMTEAKADLRAFAECEAKRKIIAHHEKFLFIIAEAYASHPDYKEEWRL